MYGSQNQFGHNPKIKITVRNTDLEKCEASYSRCWYMWDDCGKLNCWTLGFLGWMRWISIIFPALNKITGLHQRLAELGKLSACFAAFDDLHNLPTGLKNKLLIETLVKLWVSFSLFQSFLSRLKGYTEHLQMTPANFYTECNIHNF